MLDWVSSGIEDVKWEEEWWVDLFPGNRFPALINSPDTAVIKLEISQAADSEGGFVEGG